MQDELYITLTRLRTVWELCGISCIPLDRAKAAKANIMCSRSFGEAVTRKEDLREAVATFASRVAEKLRAQQSVAGALYVFVTTKHYGKGPHYTNHATGTRRKAWHWKEMRRSPRYTTRWDELAEVRA